MGNGKSQIRSEILEKLEESKAEREQVNMNQVDTSGESRERIGVNEKQVDKSGKLTEMERNEAVCAESEMVEAGGREPEQEEENREKSDSEEEGAGKDMVEAEEEISLELRPSLSKQDSKHQYEWEQRIIDETLIPNKAIYKAAIAGLDTALKAWSPPDFIPDNQAIQDILDGFDGDVSGLAERGIAVGCGVRVSVPAKLVKETGALYGNDGHRGGTSVFKTKENIIIIVFEKDPATAHRLGLRTATFMRRYDR